MPCCDRESEVARQLREAQKALDAQVRAKYAALSEDEVKTLVVDDKWLTALAAAVQTELDRISQALTGRIKELGGTLCCATAHADGRSRRPE